MTRDLSSEKTTVVATYTTRRDAEIARDGLEDRNIRALITADDAGGMHPQLQRPHGVKLAVLDRAVQTAHEALKEANLLPSLEEGDAAGPGGHQSGEEKTGGLTFSMERPAFTMTGIGILIAFGLVILALVFSTFV